MDKDTTKLTLMEYLIPLNHKFLTKRIQTYGLDRYVKKLDSLTTVQLFVFAQLMRISSYTDLSLHLKEKKKLQRATGLTTISAAQLSRKWRNLDHSFLADVFHEHVIPLVFKRFGLAQANQKLGLLNIVDASTISLCLAKYRWATLSKHKSGIKLNLRFIKTEDVACPSKVVLTEAKKSDKLQMNELVSEEPGALNVFDRGYVDYKLFDEYCEKGIRFVTRLRHNADVTVLEERPVNENTPVVKDSVIWLGKHGTRYVMKQYLRFVACKDKEGKPFTILTNDFELPAEEIGDIYRNRWQIELFFKWIKQHLHIKRCYGTSRNAVYNQIYTALITFCLTLLMQKQVQYNGSLLRMKKHLMLSWDKTLPQFIQAIFRPPGRRSKGRRKAMNFERIFRETLHQYETGKAAHLDDMTYGPLI